MKALGKDTFPVKTPKGSCWSCSSVFRFLLWGYFCFICVDQGLNIVLSVVSDGHIISGAPEWEITGDRWEITSTWVGNLLRRLSSHWLTFQHGHSLPFSSIPSSFSFSSSPHLPSSLPTGEHTSPIPFLQLFKARLLLSMNHRLLATFHLPKTKTIFSLRWTWWQLLATDI